MTLLFGITTSFGGGGYEYHWTNYSTYLHGGQTCKDGSSHNVCGLAIGY